MDLAVSLQYSWYSSSTATQLSNVLGANVAFSPPPGLGIGVMVHFPPSSQFGLAFALNTASNSNEVTLLGTETLSGNTKLSASRLTFCPTYLYEVNRLSLRIYPIIGVGTSRLNLAVTIYTNESNSTDCTANLSYSSLPVLVLSPSIMPNYAVA